MGCAGGLHCGRSCCDGTALNWVPVTGAPQRWAGPVALPQPLMAGFPPRGESVRLGPAAAAGAGVLVDDPEPLGDPPPTSATAAGGRDDGKTVATIQCAFGIGQGCGDSKTTPRNLIPFLESMRAYTDGLERARERWMRREATKAASGGSVMLPSSVTAANERIERELQLWNLRLDEYMGRVHAAGDVDDQGAVLWSVVAPLLLGHYNGPDGTTPALRPELFPGGAPPAGHGTHPGAPDLRTPFSIAAELGASEYMLPTLWGELRKKAAKGPLGDFLRDLADALEKAAWAVGIGLVVLVAVLIATR